MARASVNGITLSYDDRGSGDPVVLVMGTGSRGRVWDLHQVPALIDAGFRAVTFDNRGVSPSDTCPEGFTIDDLVADLAGLIEHLGIGGCRLVGTSMGAFVVQELALARPDLVDAAVLMATRGRSDIARSAMAEAEIELYDSGVRVPPAYTAAVQAWRNLSPRTLADDKKMADWLEIFQYAPPPGPGVRAQLGLDPIPNRLDAYRGIKVPCHVIAFADDLVCPAALGAEVAETIPAATIDIIPDTGHFGYLEDPAAVNKSMLEFFRRVC